MLFFCFWSCVAGAAEPSASQSEPLTTSSDNNRESKTWLGFLEIEPRKSLDLEQFTVFYGRPVDEIRIHGTQHTKDAVILRELQTKVGEPLREEALRQDYRSLQALDIFSEEEFYPSEEAGRLIVNLAFKETFAFLPTVALRYNEENGFSLGGGMKALNVGGRAIKLSGTAVFGGATTFALSLSDPWIAGNHFGYSLTFSKGDRRNELFDFHENSYEGDLTLSSYLKEQGRIGGRLTWLTIESDVEGKTLSEDDRDHVAELALFIGYDTRDLPLAPTRGIFSEFEIRKSGLFGTESDFWQGQLDLRGYLPLADRHRIAAFSLTTLRDGSVGHDVAPWQQFGLGGSNTIRGWELGSRTGKNQFLATTEYAYTLVSPKTVTLFSRFSAFFALDLAIFGDLGSAWSHDAEFNEHFIGGGGAGLRIPLPYVGVIRLDFGIGEEGSGVFLHFAGAPKELQQHNRVR